jgi:hypothetical protein
MWLDLVVLLHEYGHVACGHLGLCKVRKVRAWDALDLECYSPSHAMEFEADAFAFTALVSHRGVDFALYYMGIVFQFLDLIEGVMRIAGVATPDAHPAALERLAGVTGMQETQPNAKRSSFLPHLSHLQADHPRYKAALDRACAASHITKTIPLDVPA